MSYFDRDGGELAGQCSTSKQDSVELMESVEPDVDQQTPQSADALLRRTSPQLTRLTSSDHEQDLKFHHGTVGHSSYRWDSPFSHLLVVDRKLRLMAAGEVSVYP